VLVLGLLGGHGDVALVVGLDANGLRLCQIFPRVLCPPWRTLSLVNPACCCTVSYLISRRSRFPLTFRELTPARFIGSRDSWTPPPVLRLTMNALLFPVPLHQHRHTPRSPRRREGGVRAISQTRSEDTIGEGCAEAMAKSCERE
jgi:hypothetical protein